MTGGKGNCAGVRGRLRGLERAARGRLAWIDLPGGKSFFYHPERTCAELFLHAANAHRVVREGDSLPEPPEVLKVIAGLPTPEDRRRAFNAAYSGAAKPFVAYDLAHFLDTGEIVPDPRIKRKPSCGTPGPDDGGEVVVRIGKPPG